MKALPFSDNKKLTVINMFGGPGTGKSTAAADLFTRMKRNGYRVELVHEVAKDYVWEEWGHIFGEQDYIFANQHRLIRRLVNHEVDYAISDSSIILGLFYMPDWFPESFKPFVLDVFNTYTNVNVIFERNPEFPYQQWGRNESEQQAIEKDRQIRQFFDEAGIPYIVVMAGPSSVDEIYNHLISLENKNR
jgi:tRNA uridine 5-carbamoylmethylation protein Kti12